MSTATKSPVMLYTEQTPNPESLKFVTNRMLYQGTADFREEELAREWSPIAAALFDQPYTKGVYVCTNFVTITKQINYAWLAASACVRSSRISSICSIPIDNLTISLLTPAFTNS